MAGQSVALKERKKDDLLAAVSAAASADWSAWKSADLTVVEMAEM
jgi:hypothetical protein